MHPTDHTSIALVYSAHDNNSSGARYHRVTTYSVMNVDTESPGDESGSGSLPSSRGRSLAARPRLPRADRAPAATKTVDLLTQKAADRGVQLFCMPDGMKRRIANTTFYDRKRDLMQWRVEWLFHGPRAPRDEEKKEKKKPTPVARAEDAKVDETATIGSALRAHFAPGPGNAARLHELRRFRSLQERTNKNENENENETSSIGIFLAAEGRRADDPRLHRLALDATLRENLNGKRVLEFPTLHVAVLPEDQDAFPLVPENE